MIHHTTNTTTSTVGQAIATVIADTFNESALGVSITMTRERWLNIVKGVQEVIDSYDKEKNHGT